MEEQRYASSMILLGLLYSLLIFPIASSASASLNQKLVQCFNSPNKYNNSTKIIHSQSDSSYTSLLETTSQNLRFFVPEAPKPLFIITPYVESDVQSAVICCRKYKLQIKTQSGGHDFEGLSFTSDFPSFVLLSLSRFKSVDINLEDSSAWIQAAATNGEVFYKLSLLSDIHGFPAGTYPSVGFGGLLSGGGMGFLLRKYGLAADNIIDARIVDVNGRILDKRTMGKDLFWAIRGGGGASFGVILAFKIRLVPVTRVVTVFTVPRTLEQGATELLYKWQFFCDKLPDDVFMRIMMRNVASDDGKNRTILVQFRAFFLGRAEQLVEIMKERFPELGVVRKDCTEMRYVEALVIFSNYAKAVPVEALINQSPDAKSYIKAKSDFVKEPISRAGLEGLWERFLTRRNVFLVMDSLGGKMNNISQSALPFPHRRGNLFSMLYFVVWNNATDTQYNLDRTASLYSYMAPHVSKSPRAAYVNTRDLDIGRNNLGRKTTYEEAKVWGQKCFMGNFKRLALVKARVDPTNFFMNEQSIPPLFN